MNPDEPPILDSITVVPRREPEPSVAVLPRRERSVLLGSDSSYVPLRSPSPQVLSLSPIKPKAKSKRKQASLPQLNCEECRDRKVKCDKQQPACSACVAAKVPCVPIFRRRLARGRHVPAIDAAMTTPNSLDEDIRQRVRRLEAIVTRVSPVPILPALRKTNGAAGILKQGVAPAPAQAQSQEPPLRSHAMQHPDHFWTDLSAEVHGLRDVIESTPEDAEDDTAQAQAEVSTQYHRPRDISVLGLSSMGASIFDPSLILHDRSLVSQLCKIYLYQVDPILKVLHRPTLEQHLMEDTPYLGYPEGHTSVVALDTAVMYVAINSMEEGQCRSLVGRDKSDLLAVTRQASEAALEKAGLLTTRDVTVLQAFVIYLAGRQVEEPSRAVWTLLAVAVRVAKALGIDLPRTKETFFLRQMRQHLWLTICLMDVQLAFNMISQPLISANEACLSPENIPRHINDADYAPWTVDPPLERGGLADTTYALIKYRIQAFGRQTHFVPLPGASGSDGEATSDANERLAKEQQNADALCDNFIKDLMARTFGIDPSQSPFAWLVFHSTQCFAAGAKAALLKNRPDKTKQGRPEFLRVSTQVLEKTVLMHTEPRGTSFRWSITVRWHILAITLAECYVCSKATNPDVQLLRQVWPTMEAAYAHHASIIGKHRGGRLSGPLSKLMSHARLAVEAVIGSENDRHVVAVSDSSITPAVGSPDLSAVLPAETASDLWGATWESCWDDLVSAVALDDDMAMFDTQFYVQSDVL
ncbi:hypothetical protein Sste5346_006464 [Sporothrix stenoceras]|uniref:Zn(2)-C6 fungal-type domain-containing protein n=1 Tax=Sporothrix stenoceras TaxID=5173 RepID=A0ABR3YY52_9PEZI